MAFLAECLGECVAGDAAAVGGGGDADDREAVVRILLDGVRLGADSGGGTGGIEIESTPRTVSLQVPAGVTGAMLLASYEQLAPRG